RPPLLNFYCKADKNNKPGYYIQEQVRNAGSKFYDIIKQENIQTIEISGDQNPENTFAFLEGLLLSCYSFTKYKKAKDNYKLAEIFVINSEISESGLVELTNLIKAVFFARDLVNEPLSYLTAECFSKEIEFKGNESGFSVEILNK